MFRIIKAAFEKADDASTKPTIHGWSHRTVKNCTKDNSFSTHGDDWDIQITGEGPGKRGTRRP
jgi:hypothetical protein